MFCDKYLWKMDAKGACTPFEHGTCLFSIDNGVKRYFALEQLSRIQNIVGLKTVLRSLKTSSSLFCPTSSTSCSADRERRRRSSPLQHVGFQYLTQAHGKKRRHFSFTAFQIKELKLWLEYQNTEEQWCGQFLLDNKAERQSPHPVRYSALGALS